MKTADASLPDLFDLPLSVIPLPSIRLPSIPFARSNRWRLTLIRAERFGGGVDRCCVGRAVVHHQQVP